MAPIESPENPPLSVVICTHDRSALLGRTLASLAACERPHHFEVLVIANHCSDGTHALLESWAAEGRLPLRWLPEPRKGKSNALNLALQHVHTPLVAFIDDDQRVAIDFFTKVCDAAASLPEADLLCGRLTPDWDGTEPTWVHDRGRYRIYPLPVPHFDMGDMPKELGSDDLPSGGNIIVRFEWLNRIGPFSTALGPRGHDLGGAEDSEWLMRALGLGARLFYAPDIRQVHHVEPERLRLLYLLRMTYKRTAAPLGLRGEGSSATPWWAYRKLAEYALRALLGPGADRRRFYLMRSAAALGEISGFRRLARESGLD